MNKTIMNAYMELTKPRITLFIWITTTWGYYLGGQGTFDMYLFLVLSVGSSLVCAGSSVLNQYLEREYDSKMMRTKSRPIPRGIISPQHALFFGIILIFLGVILLYVKINILVSFLSIVTAFLYIMVYTPMKRVSWWNTTVGAVPGAIPPLGGWAAATGTLNFEAGMLFLIMFFWQHPHFYAIAWMGRKDYARGGFKMLPVVEPNGEKMFLLIEIFTYVLIAATVVLTMIGMTGYIYLVGAICSGAFLLHVAEKFKRDKSILQAKNLLKATVVYLPILLILIIVDAKF